MRYPQCFPAANLKTLNLLISSLSNTFNTYQANCSGKTRTTARCHGRLAILWFAAVECNNLAFCRGSIDLVKAAPSAPPVAQLLVKSANLTSGLGGHASWDRCSPHSPHFLPLISLGHLFFRVDVADSNDARVHERTLLLPCTHNLRWESVRWHNRDVETGVRRWLISLASLYRSCRHLSLPRDGSALIRHMKVAPAVLPPVSVTHLSNTWFSIARVFANLLCPAREPTQTQTSSPARRVILGDSRDARTWMNISAIPRQTPDSGGGTWKNLSLYVLAIPAHSLCLSLFLT